MYRIYSKLINNMAILENMYSKTEDTYKIRFEELEKDFANYRRNTEKEITRLKVEGSEDAIIALLPILDDLRHSIEYGNKDNKLILNKALECLKTLNIECYGMVGDKFDEEFHNCIGIDRDIRFDHNTITKVYRLGFAMNGRVIRHADVIVNNF